MISRGVGGNGRKIYTFYREEIGGRCLELYRINTHWASCNMAAEGNGENLSNMKEGAEKMR